MNFNSLYEMLLPFAEGLFLNLPANTPKVTALHAQGYKIRRQIEQYLFWLSHIRLQYMSGDKRADNNSLLNQIKSC